MVTSRLLRRGLVLRLALVSMAQAAMRPAAGQPASPRSAGMRPVWPDSGNDADPADPPCFGRGRSLAPQGPTDWDPTDRPGQGRRLRRTGERDSDPVDNPPPRAARGTPVRDRDPLDPPGSGGPAPSDRDPDDPLGRCRRPRQVAKPVDGDPRNP